MVPADRPFTLVDLSIRFLPLWQISEIHVTGESEDMTAKERLLLWSKQITEGYVGVRCDNFTTSWRDGRLFNAIIHKYRYCDMVETAAEQNTFNTNRVYILKFTLVVLLIFILLLIYFVPRWPLYHCAAGRTWLT